MNQPIDLNTVLRLALEQSIFPTVLFDEHNQVKFFNPAAERLWGYAQVEVLEQNVAMLLSLDLLGVHDSIHDNNGINQLGGTIIEIPLTRKDGSQRRVALTLSKVQVGDRICHMASVFDIAHKFNLTDEHEIRALERDVLEALTSNQSFQELGDSLCRRIESITPGVLVSICRVAERRLRPWAAPSFPAEYGPNWEGVEIGEGVAGCGTCAHRGESVMVYDINTDPLWAPYKHQMLPHGFLACWTYPIKSRNDSVIGTFAFYFKLNAEPDPWLERIADASVYLCTLAIEREEYRQRMEHLVQFDMLTGLPNRRYLRRHVDELQKQNPSQALAFFSLGVDRFKDINDTLGHMAGDQVLVTIANRLQQQLSPREFLSHTEGDIFFIVCPDYDVRAAVRMAERLQQIVGQSMKVDGHLLNLSTSIGISHAPDGGHDRDMLLSNAKSAMYQAKSRRQGSYQFFNPEMNQAVNDRLLLGGALKRAIASGALYLHYQPQVNSDSEELYGMEALARWHDPEFGEVPPGKFITLAEEIGEIENIGRWALTEVCRQMAEWRTAGVQIPVVSVNLSPLNFRNHDLPNFVAGLLSKYGLPGESLTIEITENTVMSLTPEMLGLLNAIRALGVGLSVDDFGTGFSSLSNLANLPVTEVKIDRSFIDKCREEARIQALVMAVIGIGQSLKLTVVAEGVETREQHQLLSDQPVAIVLQGYLFSRPINAQAVATWIESRKDVIKIPPQ
ncbi:hypothetical protein BHG07_12395 [Brenneria salicis ATCC 15712 = DSM 30166]|nr:hypothetical protein BHG07_12395 [Brenneria salicis ATCC 15712 = DSM 30166]